MHLHEWTPKIKEWAAGTNDLSKEEYRRNEVKLQILFDEHKTWYGERNELGNIRLTDACGMYQGFINTKTCEIVLK